MQRRRFYASPAEISDSRIVLSADESHHLIRVLRLSCGDEVFVFDGLGDEYRCRFIAVEQKQAMLEILERLTDEVAIKRINEEAWSVATDGTVTKAG